MNKKFIFYLLFDLNFNLIRKIKIYKKIPKLSNFNENSVDWLFLLKQDKMCWMNIFFYLILNTCFKYNNFKFIYTQNLNYVKEGLLRFSNRSMCFVQCLFFGFFFAQSQGQFNLSFCYL